MTGCIRALVVGLSLAGMLPVSVEAAQSCLGEGLDWGLGPTIVPADDFAQHFGARAEADWCSEGSAERPAFSFTHVLMFGGQYLWVDRSVQIPDATEARAAALLSFSLGGSQARDSRDFDPDQLAEGTPFNPGFIELGGTAAYEASADRREQHLAFGAEARYANNSPRWGQLIPSVVVRYEWVEPTASEARDSTASVTEASDRHSRLTVRGYLNLRFGYLADALSDWNLQVDGSIFRATGLEQVLEDAGWDTGEYIDVKLRFNRRVSLLGPLALTSIYGGYAAGQLPTDFEDSDALLGGVSLSVGS